MSDFIGHECGLALVRLRRPLSWYQEQYGDPAWGLRRLYLLMEKQHNRGQDGAGIAAVKFDMAPGERYMLRVRSDRNNALERIFDVILGGVNDLTSDELRHLDAATIKQRAEFVGELLLGHLRYGTHSERGELNCHPLVRKNNVASRNLAIAGNFNMTNSGQLFDQLIEYGLNPVGESDTQVILERIGYFLDREHDHLASTMGPGSFRGLDGRELAEEVSRDLDIARVLRKASRDWDGGYVFGGLLGNGDAFVCRDPSGIRPGFVHIDDEVIAVASERAALSNVFNVQPESVKPIEPGHVLVIKRNGDCSQVPFTDPLELRQCTFERVYFSRGNDPEIYKERKELGRRLAPRILEAVDHDVDRMVVAFIPNTAETAYIGLTEELDTLTRARRVDDLWDRIQRNDISREDLTRLVGSPVRAEKIAHKDQRLRTFITHDSARRDLVMHIYDITRGVVKPDDTLVVLDDSIVRGTTLRESIIRILSRLEPRRILVASSAPPIMYPDCYGIDMSRLDRFIAFEAAISLIHDDGAGELLDEAEARCAELLDGQGDLRSNPIGPIYDRLTLARLEDRIAELVRPADLEWKGEIQVIYQSVEDLRGAMPGYTGDWYFTGNFPTPGGFRVVARSFLNWRHEVDARAY